MAKKKNNSNSNRSSGGGGEEGNKENGGGGGVIAVVLKVDLHCEGCAGKVVKAIRSLDGVDSVRIGDTDLNKLTVTGKLDPSKLRQKVEEKTRKKVEIISPATKKNKNDNDNGEKAHPAVAGEDNKQHKQQNQNQKPKPDGRKTADKKEEKKPKELPVTTAVLKVPLHCQGCIQKIRKLITKTKGYTEMSIDKNKDLVTVKGTMDVKALAEALKDKLKRPVEILPANAKKDADGGDKKGKGGGEKKGKGGGEDAGDGEGGGKVEARKMEQSVLQPEYPYPQYVYGPGYMVNYVHAPQLFSDENPNACTIM